MLTTPAPPKTPRGKRAASRAAPHILENPRRTLLLKGARTSAPLNALLTDLHTLKTPLSTRFSRKNPDLHPFASTASLDFFAAKNDTSLLALATHQKKRPHCLTLARTFDARTLDLLELLLDPATFRPLASFKTRKPSLGLKPLLVFAGTAWDAPDLHDSPAGPWSYPALQSILLDVFKGADTPAVDVEGLQYVLSFTVGATDAATPTIHLRGYLVSTKRAGARLPRVELEEMGPRVDFRVGRVRVAEEAAWKEAMKQPRGAEARPAKNVETDAMGDKLGRIHLGKQDLKEMQTRKMKGLKRGRGEEGAVEDGDGRAAAAAAAAEEGVGETKRARI